MNLSVRDSMHLNVNIYMNAYGHLPVARILITEAVDLFF